MSTTTASRLTCFTSCVHGPPLPSAWMKSRGQWQAGRAAAAALVQGAHLCEPHGRVATGRERTSNDAHASKPSLTIV